MHNDSSPTELTIDVKSKGISTIHSMNIGARAEPKLYAVSPQVS